MVYATESVQGRWSASNLNNFLLIFLAMISIPSAESFSSTNRFRCSCMILAPIETPSLGVTLPSVQISRISLS